MNGCFEPRCATCRHWNRQGPQIANATRDPGMPVGEGTCQAHSPVLMHIEPAPVAPSARWPVPLFPRTHESRVCGEWAPRTSGGGDDGERIIVFPLERSTGPVAA